MREQVRSSKISGFAAAAVAAVWLLCAGPAWAGGASDAAGLLSLLCDTLAGSIGISCPQYPTYANTTTTPPTPISPATPIIVELAAWENVSPDSIRMKASDCDLFGTLNGPGTGNFYCPQLAVNATNGPVTPRGSNDQNEGNANSPVALSFLNSLAFISNGTVPLTVTQNSVSTANSFIYAAVLEDKSGQPKTLDIFYDYIAAPSSQGKVKVSFPLAVLVNGASVETSVVATLTATCFGDGSCSNVKVSANLPGTTKTSFSPADLGLSFTYSFGPSPNSSSSHPIGELRMPLLVNSQTDPLYFPISGIASLPQCANGSNPISGYCNAFSPTSPPNGFAPKFLTNTVVGMAPSAAPQCPGNQPGLPSPPGALCPAQSDPTKAPIPPTFGFCASFSGNAAAAFFLAIGPDGTTYTSSPVNPALSGAPYPACPS